MELAADCARLAKQHGLKNVFVSNGYQTRETIDFAAEWLDAINVDLKAFSEELLSPAVQSKAPARSRYYRIHRQTYQHMDGNNDAAAA